MKKIIHKNKRGKTETDWLESWHSFSFGEYYDPQNMGFGPLRVINEDIVAPEGGFATHGHKNMEIITYVMSGALEHKDSLGNGSVIRPGDIQMMSAGKGILHSEVNPSSEDPVHLLQIWILPSESGTSPGYQQKRFAPEDMHNRLRLIVSPDGAEESLVIRQEAKVFAGKMAEGAVISFDLMPDKKYWLQVAEGDLSFGDEKLSGGDALSLEKEEGTATIRASAGGVDLLLFELPS